MSTSMAVFKACARAALVGKPRISRSVLVQPYGNGIFHVRPMWKVEDDDTEIKTRSFKAACFAAKRWPIKFRSIQ